VRRHAAQPWSLYLAFNAPHGPLQPTSERYNQFASIASTTRRNYAAQVSLQDDAVSETLAALGDTGQQSKTLAFFFSDNGGPEPYCTSNTPWRGWNGHMYEGGRLVPFVASWPGALPSGVDYTQKVVRTDRRNPKPEGRGPK